MLNSTPFYHSHIKNAIVAFGRIFSNISIIRENPTDPTKNQHLEIPLTYAPKEKWLVRVEQDPELNNQVHTVLPRMSFEINGFSYDATRKLNRMNRISNGQVAGVQKNVFTPVPYNLDISLYILTKTQGDNLQIVEQILPVFTPDYTIGIDAVPDLNLENDLPIILNSVSVDDEYEGDFQTRRFVTTTMSFTLKLNVYSNVTNGKVILGTKIAFKPSLDVNSTMSEILTLTASTVGGPITANWTTTF